MIISSILLVAFILVATYVYLFLGRKTNEHKIPGLQPTNPQTGNFLDIQAAGSIHDFLVKLHKEHGNVASFWLGPEYHVSAASPESFKALKASRYRPTKLFQHFMPVFGPHSVIFLRDEEHRLRRGVTGKAFGHDWMSQFCDVFNKIVEELITTLSSLPPNDPIPLIKYITSLAIKGATQSFLGDDFKGGEDWARFVKYYETCWDDISLRMTGYIPEEGSERVRKFNEALNGMKDIVRENVSIRKKNQTRQQEMKFIDLLVENEDMFPEETLLDESLTYVIEAFNTSGYLLVWMLYFLALNPEAEERVYKEIVNVIGEENGVSPNNVGDLKYMKQALQETLRLSILGTFGGRILDEDITLGGYVVKKNTPIVIPIAVLHEDETIWPNVSKFDPDRFSPENVKQRHPDAFRPFGLPGRMCPGYRYTYYQSSVFLALLIRKFKWSLVEGQEEINRHYGFVTCPDKEIWMRITPRA